MNENELPDDPTILDDAAIWRRIHPAHRVFDETHNRMRIFSGAFTDSSDTSPMSVILGDDLISSGCKPASVLTGLPEQGVASFFARLARKHGQRIARTPQEDEPHHASVIGQKKRVKKILAHAVTGVIRPPKETVRRRLREELAEKDQVGLLEMLGPLDPYDVLLPAE